jgi:5-carboxymethyl-2-hydroxymuconate isomerase
MPHFIAEYSANLEGDVDFEGLFERVHTYMGDSGVFPLGGIRSRAVRADIFRMADGKHDYAFIHLTLKVGHGRDLETRRRVAEGIFDIATAHFEALQAKRLLALSFEMIELHDVLNFKKNNIHAFLKAQS